MRKPSQIRGNQCHEPSVRPWGRVAGLVWLLSAASMLVGAEPFKASMTLASQPATNLSRVVMVEDFSATVAFEPQLERVNAMMAAGLVKLTGKPDVAAAWASLVKPSDVVGVKVHAAPGPVVGTRPAVVEAVVRGLLAAKIPASHIVIWDRRLLDLKRSGYDAVAAKLGVRLAGAMDTGWDANTFYDTPLLGSLHWGDLEFVPDETRDKVVGRKSFVSRLLTHDITKLVVVAPLLNDNVAGVAGQLYTLALGSVDNTARFTDDPDHLATAVPELCALPQLAERVVLHVNDALLGQYVGGTEARLHYTANVGQLRFSHDPVALDVLAVADLERLRAEAKFSPGETNAMLYHNAALMELGTATRSKIAVETIR